MPDIFISYKKEEREVAALLAARLTEGGYDVWWDDALLAGERFEDEISAVLDDSKVVVVLWSRQSITSDWVKAEAESARQQRKGLPVIIDDLPAARMPLLYRGMHAARLMGWAGEPDHDGYRELIGTIEDRMGRATGPRLTAPEAEAKLERSAERAKAMARDARPAKPRSPFLWIGVAVAALVLIAGGAFAYLQMTSISAADQAAIDRCAAWSMSAAVDWYTTLPLLDRTTLDDCTRANTIAPENGNYMGMLAMVRIAQGPQFGAEAIALANRSIDRKGATGNYAMGVMYARGLNLGIDPAKAATYIRAAADLGMARAQGRLCLMAVDNNLTLPISVTRDEITGYCGVATEAGDADALLATGFAYEAGVDGRIVNAASAAQYYERASNLGSDEATVRLGILYHRGLGVAQDVYRAIALYQQSADNGDPSGMRSLAVALELGEGIQRDVNRAAQLYEEASVRRDVASLLFAGYAVAPDIPITARVTADLNLLAASPTVPTAQRMRGQLLARGFLRPLDYTQAESEFTACTDTGNSMCEVALGFFLQFVKKSDIARAIALYESAASSGNLYGQYYLGYAYDLGDGVAQDPNKAIEYYRLAARQGHLTSANRLSQLGQPLQ